LGWRAKTHGADFSVEDKTLIAETDLPVWLDYIEAGYPARTRPIRACSRAPASASAKLTASA
jgi:hypothetical protein